MITLISILLLVLFVWLTIKIVPAVLGFTFSLFLAILQIIGVLLLVPVIGLAFFALDIIFIGLIVVIVKAIF